MKEETNLEEGEANPWEEEQNKEGEAEANLGALSEEQEDTQDETNLEEGEASGNQEGALSDEFEGIIEPMDVYPEEAMQPSIIHSSAPVLESQPQTDFGAPLEEQLQDAPTGAIGSDNGESTGVAYTGNTPAYEGSDYKMVSYEKMDQQGGVNPNRDREMDVTGTQMHRQPTFQQEQQNINLQGWQQEHAQMGGQDVRSRSDVRSDYQIKEAKAEKSETRRFGRR